MIGLSAVSAGATSSYGILRKNLFSYGYAFNYGFNLNYYPITQDPIYCYLYEDVYLNYLKIDDKVILPNNSYLPIYNFDDTIDAGAQYRDDGFGVGPVGAIDSINSYLQDTVKSNDFKFYTSAGFNMILRAATGRKMIMSIYADVAQTDAGINFFNGSFDWTFYFNYPYSSANKTITSAEISGPIELGFDGTIDSLVGSRFYWG